MPITVLLLGHFCTFSVHVLAAAVYAVPLLPQGSANP
jgi:hypothetical protein